MSIAGSALALFGSITYSCSPFDKGSSSTSSSSSGSVDGGGLSADGAVVAPDGGGSSSGGGPSCAFEEILVDRFGSSSLDGWQRKVAPQGVFEVIQQETGGPTPAHDSYASLSGTLGGEFNASGVAMIQRSFTRSAKAAKVTFDLAHRTMGNKTDFGCRLGFGQNSKPPSKAASAILRYEGTQNLVFDALLQSEGVTEEGIAGKATLAQPFPINQWRNVTIDLELIGQQVAAGVTIDGIRTTIPPFAFGANVDTIGIACGIEYMEPQPPAMSNRLSEVALDELHLSVCPL